MMRLDYFMLSHGVERRLAECVQATDRFSAAALGFNRPDGAFFGSDHCAVYLKLRPLVGRCRLALSNPR